MGGEDELGCLVRLVFSSEGVAGLVYGVDF